MALETEMDTYRHEMPSLMANQGKFVVISESKVVGIFGTYEDALQSGYKECKMKPFLVKKIEAVEQVHSFTRDIDSCPT